MAAWDDPTACHLKINVGASVDLRPGFINTDIYPYPGLEIVGDVRQLDQHIRPETAAFIVAQHLLECIPRKDVFPLLQLFSGLLEPGGVLEIRVIDINLVMKAMNLNQVSGELGIPQEMALSLIYGRQANPEDVRRSGFTSQYLQGMLEAAGTFRVTNVTFEEYDVIASAEKE